MGKNIAISFEDDNIKIVHASFKNRHLNIDKTEIIPVAELDYYLRKEKTREFIVTCNFTNFDQGILTIPPVKTRYLEKIVELEIRKATGARDFSFVYTSLGERIAENKKVLDVFYFTVRNEDIRDTIERFYINGKIVKALYPSVFSVASLFNPQTFGDGFHKEAIIGVSGTGRERILFLTKNGAIHFIRTYQALQASLSDFDIQNINMTINYCSQNLRINPSLVLLTGVLSESYSPEDGISATTSAPLTCLYKSDYIHCSRETFNEFIIPIASFYAPKSSNILSREFKNIYMLKNGLLTAARVFVAVTILCLGFIFNELKDTAHIDDKLKSIRQKNSDVEKIFSEYTAKEAEIKRYSQLLDLLNMSRPSIQKLLITLSELNTKDFIFKSIEALAKEEDNAFLITISGMSSANTYTSMQTSFRDLTDKLDKMEDLEITSKTMQLGDKTFRIEIKYKE